MLWKIFLLVLSSVKFATQMEPDIKYNPQLYDKEEIKNCENIPFCNWFPWNYRDIGDRKLYNFPSTRNAHSSYGTHNSHSRASNRKDLSRRSYYNGFGSPSAHAYYPTFDPISILASLAFLAFLLQSFASLFDRSRSIFPTIVSSRETDAELAKDNLTKRVLRALNNYENVNRNFIENQD